MFSLNSYRSTAALALAIVDALTNAVGAENFIEAAGREDELLTVLIAVILCVRAIDRLVEMLANTALSLLDVEAVQADALTGCAPYCRL